jgi:hypothetical protein
MTWLVRCATQSEAEQLRARLPALIELDNTLVDEVRAFPGGAEQVSRQTYRLGDYFASIQVLPDTLRSPSTSRVLFQRREDAGPFWKDLMARVLGDIRDAAPGTSTLLLYRGDAAPEADAAQPATHVAD